MSPRRPRRSSVNAPASVTTILVAVLLLFGVNTWFVMLIAGGLGHVFGQPALFLGFGESALVVVALSTLSGIVRGVGK